MQHNQIDKSKKAYYVGPERRSNKRKGKHRQPAAGLHPAEGSLEIESFHQGLVGNANDGGWFVKRF